ncbi:MAG: DUF2062 domain-containing protein [Candidatus Omnitrophica bacterium]|nr:DUF2062 domain-containing protein [Candidatus Omnitrophota bacterium]
MKKIKAFFKSLYLKLFKIDDSPQKVALGFGLGVFLGIFPGTGPIAALFLSLLLRVNRPASLIGCLLTNTWISFVAFILAIKCGALLFGMHWQDIRNAPIKFIFPVAMGYVLIGLVFGFIAYLATLFLIKYFKGRKHADK